MLFFFVCAVAVNSFSAWFYARQITHSMYIYTLILTYCDIGLVFFFQKTLSKDSFRLKREIFSFFTTACWRRKTINKHLFYSGRRELSEWVSERGRERDHCDPGSFRTRIWKMFDKLMSKDLKRFLYWSFQFFFLLFLLTCLCYFAWKFPVDFLKRINESQMVGKLVS